MTPMPRRTTAVAAPVAHLVGPGQLKVINGNLAFKAAGEGPLRLDPSALATVYCYGDVSVSGAALDLLFRHGVKSAWLTPAGHRCRGRLERADPRTTRTRVRQHRAFATLAARLDWAKAVVTGKLDAMSAAARHHQRHGVASAAAVLTALAPIAERLASADSLDSVRGFEGAATAAWFAFYATLLRDPWSFPGRTRRPPTDPVNALLSLGYTWLNTRAVARLEADGYEVYVGGLHAYRPGRPSLACDLIEPLRVPAVDRWVHTLCSRRQIEPGDLAAEENGGFRLKPAAFARTLHAWETHWVNNRLDDEFQRWTDRLAAVITAWDAPDPDPEAEVTDL